MRKLQTKNERLKNDYETLWQSMIKLMGLIPVDCRSCKAKCEVNETIDSDEKLSALKKAV